MICILLIVLTNVLNFANKPKLCEFACFKAQNGAFLVVTIIFR